MTSHSLTKDTWLVWCTIVSSGHTPHSCGRGPQLFQLVGPPVFQLVPWAWRDWNESLYLIRLDWLRIKWGSSHRSSDITNTFHLVTPGLLLLLHFLFCQLFCFLHPLFIFFVFITLVFRDYPQPNSDLSANFMSFWRSSTNSVPFFNVSSNFVNDWVTLAASAPSTAFAIAPASLRASSRTSEMD